jgi:hypothetical protein
MMVMPVEERMSHRPEEWEFHSEQLGKYKAPHCTVFLRNDRLETTQKLFLGKDLTLKRKMLLARPRSMV